MHNAAVLRGAAVESTPYDITPDPTLLEDIGSASFTVPEAIVELVANTIDARVDEDKLHIEIVLDDDSVSVIDDGVGMTEDVLANAVRLSVKGAAEQPKGRARKGMYGLGLKTACASMGRHWSVITRPLGEDREYRVEFDLASWTSRVGDRSFRWEVPITRSASDRTGPLGQRKHGTAVVVRKLRQSRALPGAVQAQLAVAYKPHLEQGDDIRVNGEPVLAGAFDFIEGSRHTFDLDVGPDEKGKDRRIRGWVALDKKTHNDGNFGFNLYRQDQCIETWNKEWFPAHLMTSRIIGEAHLDFVKPNFHKKGFAKESAEWKLARSEMTEYLKPTVKASRTMAIGRHDAGRFARALEGLNRARGASGAVGPLGDGGIGTAVADPPLDPARGGADDTGVGVTAGALRLGDGEVQLVVTVDSFESEETPWDYIYDGKVRELQAVLNSNSRLFKRVKDEQFLGMLALADCVSSFLTTEKSFSPQSARDIRNRWLFEAVSV